jgi:hypothetical protein
MEEETRRAAEFPQAPQNPDGAFDPAMIDPLRSKRVSTPDPYVN